MFWWEDDWEERERLGELEDMVLERLAGPYESREEYEWLRRMRIWVRPGHPEVLTAGLDSAEARAILESSYGLMGEIASSYERISTIFMGEEALVTPAGEFADMLRCQAIRMRDLLETLMPAVNLLYRDYGGRGRIWRGVREALRATGSDPTSSVIARAFEYACALCHALEAFDDRGYGHTQRLPEESTSESRWYQLVWQEVVRSASAVECEAPVSTMRWARLGVAGLRYVDVADSLRCIAERPYGEANTLPADAGSLRLVARGPQRVWSDYYLVIESDARLTSWLGESAYAVTSEEGVEVWPENAYLNKIGCMVGSLEGKKSCQAHELRTEWARLVHAPRALVGDCLTLLPLDFVFSHDLPSIGVVPSALQEGRILLSTSSQ